MKKQLSAIFLLLFVSGIALRRLPIAHIRDDPEVTITGPDVEMGVPPKVPERPFALLLNGLRKNRRAEKFTVWSGALGSTTQLEYNRRRQTLTTSFYLLDEDFYSHWRNVSESTIAVVAAVEKKGNVIWWKNGEFHETRIDSELVLKKHGALTVAH